MGTTVAPRSSSIAGEIFANQPSGLGQLGGMLVDLAPMYNSLADLGGVMRAASDTQGDAGAGITDTADPSKAPKKDITAERVDKITKRADEIRSSTMSDEGKKIALSELLTGEGIPHDPNSLDPYSPSDKFGLLSKRINIVDPVTPTPTATGSVGGSISASDAVAGAAGGGIVDVIRDAAAADALEGSLEADSDLMGDIDTIVDSVAQNGSTDVSGGSTETVEDVRETWTYDKATDSFISTVRGDSIPRTGDPDVPLKDGGEYSVRPIAGTEGVTAEHVVDEESGESVGAFTIDILTGLPTLKKITDETAITDTTDTAVNGTADVGPAAPTGVDDSGTATGGGISVTGTLSGDKYAGVSRNGGGTLVLNTAGTDGTDGADGQDGADGKDGRDGKDGKDGLTGLLALSSIATPIADEIFTREFKMDYLKPEFIGLLDLNKGRTS